MTESTNRGFAAGHWTLSDTHFIADEKSHLLSDLKSMWIAREQIGRSHFWASVIIWFLALYFQVRLVLIFVPEAIIGFGFMHFATSQFKLVAKTPAGDVDLLSGPWLMRWQTARLAQSRVQLDEAHKAIIARQSEAFSSRTPV